MLGPSRYARYLRIFGLDSRSLLGRSVADFGCGPFGGVLAVLEGLRGAFPLDTLASEYNRWGKSSTPVRPVDSETCATNLPDDSCDAVFHLAAAVGVGQSQYQIEHYVDINMRGTATLFDILVNRKNKVKKRKAVHRMVRTFSGSVLSTSPKLCAYTPALSNLCFTGA